MSNIIPQIPVEIKPSLPAGTYQVTLQNKLYEITLSEDLHGLEGYRSVIELEGYSVTGRIVKKCGKSIFDGSTDEGWARQSMENVYNRFMVSPSGITNTQERAHILATMFHDYSSNTDDSDGICFQRTNYLYFYALGCATVPDFLSLLASSPMDVVYPLAIPTITPLTLTHVSSSTAPVLPTTVLTLADPSTEYPFGEKSVEGVTVTCASGVPSARPATTATTTDTLRGMPVTSDYSHPTYTDNAGQAWVADTIERKGGIVTKTVRIDPIDLTVPLSAQMDKIKANPVVTDITSAEDGQALLGLKSYPHQTTILSTSEVIVGVKQMD